LDGRGWAEIDFILDQFRLPTTDEWPGSDQFDYVRSMLGNRFGADDEALVELENYLVGNGQVHATEDEPWDKPGGRLFITHLAVHKGTADSLKDELEEWGLDGFVAHKDISPGREWVRVIIAALNTCDALVALLHDGIKVSDWCDQEVGVGLGRGIPVIPVRIDLDPYGLAGVFQGVPWATDRPHTACAGNIVDVLLNDKRTRALTIEAMVLGLERATSFHMANQIANKLAGSGGDPLPVMAEQIDRLRQAQRENSQVAGAFHVESAVSRLEQVHHPRSAQVPQSGGSGWDEEPF
jgi:hypothetical protein